MHETPLTVRPQAKIRPRGKYSRLRSATFALGAALVFATGATTGNDGGFQTPLRAQPVDTPFVTTVRLEDALSFRDRRGKLWQADRGQVFDGSGFPPLFRDLVGSPLEGAHPKSAIVYEAMTQKMREDWNDSRRMFLEAALAEGVEPVDAKVMYLLLAAQGSRWETPDSRCFGSCHPPSGKRLFWRPVTKEARVASLVEWVREVNPPVEEIDRAAPQAIRATGPHIVTQPDCSRVSSALMRFRLNCD